MEIVSFENQYNSSQATKSKMEMFQMKKSLIKMSLSQKDQHHH